MTLPGRGQGDTPKARGSEWYTNTPKICPQHKFRATFQLSLRASKAHRVITCVFTLREGDAMAYNGNFDFFYGMESERYNFIIIPKLLMKDERFNHISAEAKLMYGLFLDRNSLSQKNGWLDEKNRVYIIYTIEEIKKDLGCATEKVNKVLKELEEIGLIYRKRNGRGKANYIYVMDYMAIYRNANDSIFMNFENRKSRNSNSENQDFRKSKGNKTDTKHTENRYGSSTKKKNSFCNFPQRDYDFDELERILLSNRTEK